MDWKVARYNPKQKKATLISHEGHRLEVVIPDEHKTSVQKTAFLKAQTDEQDKALIVAPVVKIEEKKKGNFKFYAIMALEAIAIVALVIFGKK